jgi:hypothetical protein
MSDDNLDSNVPPAYVPPAYPAPDANQPAYSPSNKPKQALSLTSFIVGLAALVVLLWIPFLNVIAALAAVILAFIAKAREPQAPRWMWVVGMVAGFVALAIALIYTALVIVGIALAASGDYSNLPTSP